MAITVKLAAYGVTFATRQRAAALVAEMPANGDLKLDFRGVKVASPSFVDGLVGGLSERAGRVEITRLAPEIESLVVHIVERRGLSSRFRFLAAA